MLTNRPDIALPDRAGGSTAALDSFVAAQGTMESGVHKPLKYGDLMRAMNIIANP
jgi:hypothetical protein